MHIVRISLLPFVAACLAAQAPSNPAPARAGNDLVATAVAAGQFSTLVRAVQAAGLADTLRGPGPFTVIAPTDAAFARLGERALADLLLPENKAKLTAILTYHVVAGSMPAAQVTRQKELTSLQGSPLVVASGKDGVTIGGAKVVTADVAASNGTIHVVDTVLMPPADLVATAAKAGTFRTLLAAATAAGLAETLATGGPFTVFAPTDEAFAELGQDRIDGLLRPENKADLAAILKFHVVAGRVRAADVVAAKELKTLQGGTLPVAATAGKVTVGGANVVTTDVIAGNGVIHVVDAVLLPR